MQVRLYSRIYRNIRRKSPESAMSNNAKGQHFGRILKYRHNKAHTQHPDGDEMNHTNGIIISIANKKAAYTL